MSSDLYAQFRMVEAQCRMRALTEDQTRELMQLCPYAFAYKYPERKGDVKIDRRGRVISAH